MATDIQKYGEIKDHDIYWIKYYYDFNYLFIARKLNMILNKFFFEFGQDSQVEFFIII